MFQVVRTFYAYWSAYCTLRPYSWLDKYTIDTLKEVPRRVQRLMEKENKKLRDVGRKQRNEEVRALVNFVRKRDPRVKAYIVIQPNTFQRHHSFLTSILLLQKLLEEKAAQNAIKTKLQQERHREERRKLLEQTPETTKFGFTQMSDLEQQLKARRRSLIFKQNARLDNLYILLQAIEAQYASSAESSDYEDDDDDDEVIVLEENEEIVKHENEEVDGEAVEKGETVEAQTIENQENLAEDDDSDDYDEELLDLYCPACKKNFKTVKS